ncbi:ligase [Aureococcus anophagefferens]|uniref:Ligase n=1 Tax=Aureococcus anophagefferens TaxID=44056 RepID=A0ABR1GCS1_AURAN
MRHESQAARWQNSTPANPQSKKTRASSRTPSQQPAAATQAAMWAGLPVPAADAVSVPPARKGDTTFAAEQLALRRSGEVGCDMWAPLEAAAAARGDDVALHDLATNTSLSYAAVLARASRLGAWLRSAGGASAGARVGLMTPNCAPAIECHYAIAGWAGCVALNLNPRLSPDELAYCLEGADCEVLVADTSYAGLVVEASRRYEKIRAVVWTDVLHKAAADLDVPTVLYETIVADGPVVERPEDAKALPGSAGAEMYYTSGTSGRPKGVVLSRETVLLHALGCMVEHRIKRADVWLHCAPMFHLVDAYAIFAVTWVAGTHVTVPAFAAAPVFDALRDHRVTVSNVASTMVTLLLADPAVGKADASSLEMLSCGGAPLSAATVLNARDLRLRVNEMNYLTITDRAKDMILVGSENVYCVEVERVLNDHPGAVVVKQDDSLTAAALRRHAAAKLADFKVPSSIEFVARADLPMTGSGKVAKALKKRAPKLAEERKAARASRKQAAQPPSGIADHVYGVTWVDAPLAAEARRPSRASGSSSATARASPRNSPRR